MYYKQCNIHRPGEGVYGDCVRTVIACLLDKNPLDVPHFYHGVDTQDDADKAWLKMITWLNGEGYSLFTTAYYGEGIEPAGIMQSVNALNPGVRFILWGQGRGGTDHVVICRNGKIEHDPSFLDTGIVRPQSDGNYLLSIIVPLLMTTEGIEEEPAQS